jgi:hypothetical protein
LKIGREELRDGYIKVMTDLYECEPYFDRLEALYIEGNLRIGEGRLRWWRKHPWHRLKTETMWLGQAIGLFARIMRDVPEAHLRREYRKRLRRFLKHTKNPGAVLFYIIHIAQHYHAYTMTRQMSSGRSHVYNSW